MSNFKFIKREKSRFGLGYETQGDINLGLAYQLKRIADTLDNILNNFDKVIK